MNIACTSYNRLVEAILVELLNISLFYRGEKLTLGGSNYPCLERSSMIPKMFK